MEGTSFEILLQNCQAKEWASGLLSFIDILSKVLL